MDILENSVLDFINKYKIKNCLVGFSGGVDSTVLLHILKNHSECNVRAIFVDHSLSNQEDEWASFCKKYCYDNNIDFIYSKVDAKPKSRQSTEDSARIKRYEAYKDVIKEDEVLILGHHSDDQVETVLLQLLRGAGVKGLSGMAEYSSFHNGFLARPFMNEYKEFYITKEDIENYAENNKIAYSLDHSNKETVFKRNAIRNDVIPILKEHFPNINKSITRSAINCAESANMIEKQANTLVVGILDDDYNIDIKKAKELDEDILSEVIRLWMNNYHNERSLSKKCVNEVVRCIKNSQNDSNFHLKWGDKIVKRVKGIMIVKDFDENELKKTNKRKIKP